MKWIRNRIRGTPTWIVLLLLGMANAQWNRGPPHGSEGLTPGPRLESGPHVIVSRVGGECLAGSVWAFWSGGDPEDAALIVWNEGGEEGWLSAVSAWAPVGRGRARTVGISLDKWRVTPSL